MRRLLLAVALAVLLPAPAHAEGLTGTVGALPKGAKAAVRAVDRTTGLVVARATPSRRGTYALTLPPGAYTVLGVVVRPGKAVRRVRAQATLRRGQRRRGVRLASVQESGRRTAGKVAVGFERIAAGTGDTDVDAVAPGISDLLLTAALDTVRRCDGQVIEWGRRDDVIRELEFQQSRYVDPSTAGKRDLIEPDVLVKGRITKDLTLTLRVVEVATGTVLATVVQRLGERRFFEDIAKAGAAVTKDLCKLTDAYEAKLDVRGLGTYATHTGTGVLRATVLARRGTGAEARAFRAEGPLAWQELVFTAKDPECRMTDVQPGSLASWTVSFTVAEDGTLRGLWTAAPDGTGTWPSATYVCPELDRPAPGFTGPGLTGSIPQPFTLPPEGGVVTVPPGLNDGTDGFFNTGTLTITPKGVAVRR